MQTRVDNAQAKEQGEWEWKWKRTQGGYNVQDHGVHKWECDAHMQVQVHKYKGWGLTLCPHQ